MAGGLLGCWYRYAVEVGGVSRGLGAVESFVVMNQGLSARRPRLARDVARDLAHERVSFAHPSLGLADRCDCGGRCVVVNASAVNNVLRAVGSLELKGIVSSELDAWGRRRVRLVSWPLSWEFRPDDGKSHLCPGCGRRSASRAVRGEAA